MTIWPRSPDPAAFSLSLLVWQMRVDDEGSDAA